MQIINREEYKNISISKLHFSNRTFNCLKRKGYDTLYLLIENRDSLPDIPNLGEKSLLEIKEYLCGLQMADLPGSNQRSNSSLYELPEAVLSRPATDLRVSERVLNSLRREGIKTIADVLELEKMDILHMRNMGTVSQKQLQEQIDLLKDLGADYFIGPSGYMADKRAIDIDTVKRLQKDYFFQIKWLCEWYGVSRQTISQKLSARYNKGRWCGKELLKEERAVITEMINAESFYIERDYVKYYLLNNRKDDCAFLIVSVNDIKCFFLRDLPVAVQALLKSHDLQRFSAEECKIVKNSGQTIQILKKPYYMPDDAATFNRLASTRGLTPEEYSQYLYGMSYISPRYTITDNRIIAFLQDNTIGGITSIPALPENQWIRSFISRSPYNTEEFIAFYGFKTQVSVDEVEFDFMEDHDDVAERDMQVYDAGTNETSTIERIYAASPLLGSAILSEKDLEKINKTSQTLMDLLVENPKPNVPVSAKMTITFSVIQYAKNWDSEDESGFWKYIATQFGYRDDSETIRNMLCRYVKDALVQNHRFFLTNASGNQYKASVLIHAFATKRSWICFCDFLFDFYKTNLDWEYREGDPIIARMVYALRNRFSENLEADDDDIVISSKVYNFREGIIKLILNRPQYAVQLVSLLIKRIDALVNHTSGEAESYEEQICDEWMAQKIGGIASTKRRRIHGERKRIAIDYKTIKPVYHLYDESEVQIVFPDVRLAQNKFSSLCLIIKHGENVIEKKHLQYYGNELGRTMMGFVYNLEDYLRQSGSSSFDPQFIITCDSNEIYNSEKTLYRNQLCFRDKAEADLSTCTEGRYSLFTPGAAEVSFENTDVLVVIKETSIIKGIYVELRKDFAIHIDRNLVAFDNEQVGRDFHLVDSVHNSGASYLINGIHYSVVSGNDRIHLIASNAGLNKKYRLIVNEKMYRLEELSMESSPTGTKIYSLDIGKYGADEVDINLVNFENNHVLLRRYYKIIPFFKYCFNRAFYFSDEDYKEAKLQIRIDSDVIQEYPVVSDDSHISISYQEGEIVIQVPKVKVFDNSNIEWDGTNRYWIQDIPQTRFLEVISPADLKVQLTLDGQVVGAEKPNIFGLGNAIYGYSRQPEKDWLSVVLKISQNDGITKECFLGKIAVREQFEHMPVVKYEGHKLTWDLGGGFIGDPSGAFQLSIISEGEDEDFFSLKLDQEMIAEEIELPLGEYTYKISKKSGNLFELKLEQIAMGTFFVGDKNELRFRHHIIQIDAITYEEENNSKRVNIKPCFIDQIKYQGVQFAESEMRKCPVYSGIMYYENREKRRDYSYKNCKDWRGNALYQINPVRIVYINDSTLCITNEDKDGLYYDSYHDNYSQDLVFQITDREPVDIYNPLKRRMEHPDNYYLADLYSYTRIEE